MIISKNKSNEVLDVFNELNLKLEESDKETARKLDSLVNSSSNTETRLLDSVSNKLLVYIEYIKTEVLISLDSKDYESMDSPDLLDTYFFEKEQLSEEGIKFKNEIKNYTDILSEVFSSRYPEIIKNVELDFNIDDLKGKDWLEFNFKGFPQIASLTKLTQMQSDIKSIRKKLIFNISDIE